MKICRRCEIEKPLSDFSLRTGKTTPVSECKSCSVDRSRERRKLNPEKARQADRDHYLKNKDAILKKNRLWVENNRDAYSAYQSDYFQKNKFHLTKRNREWVKANKPAASIHNRNYRQLNRSVLHRRAAFRRLAMRTATPKWADKNRMREKYQERDELILSTGLPYQVDHIVPVLGPLVTTLDFFEMPQKGFVGPLFPIVQGLHCEANMQVILRTENMQKNNWEWPDMPDYPFKQLHYWRI